MSPVLLGRVSGSQAFASLASLRRVSREVFEPTYVDDVFSTFLYEGTGSTQSINNGIDLSGEGGLVWLKSRSSSWDHSLFDTERGAEKFLKSSYDVAELTGGALTQFNSNGFSIDGSGSNYQDGNNNGDTYVSWSFSKAPGFFDVVTYTGSGSARTVSHNLGSVPGMIIVKAIDDTAGWYVYHRSLGNTGLLRLNVTNASTSTYSQWNQTDPTASVFSLAGQGYNVNESGVNYVAYIFAHDDQSFGTDSDEAIIKCGTYEGNGGTNEINLGFEFQWLLIKNADSASDAFGNADWTIVDNMRGASTDTSRLLYANLSNAEGFGGRIFPTPTGFKIDSESNIDYNASGDTYIYVAIRRPHKPPTAATEVFKAVQTTSQPFSVGFPADLNINTPTTNSGSKYWVPRLTNNYMSSTATGQESAGTTYFKFDLQDSFSTGSFWGSWQTINWQFRRAPGFFDVVAYEGTGSATTITHNLNATPSVVLIKGRDTTFSWYWQHYALGANTWVQLNNDEVKASNGSLFNNTLPTSSVFSVGSLAGNNGSGNDYIAYLFGDLDGISKAGTYSGTGSNINVDCGFTAGARFVLIKRTDSTGDWYVWDTLRGIVSGNDPYLLMNSTAAQVTNTDYIDPLNAGFTVTSNAPAALNTSGGEYLFLAIA